VIIYFPWATDSRNHLIVLAIFSILFCFIPLGIVSLVYAIRARSLLDSGAIDQAHDASEKAKKWLLSAVIAQGILVLLFWLF